MTSLFHFFRIFKILIKTFRLGLGLRSESLIMYFFDGASIGIFKFAKKCRLVAENSTAVNLELSHVQGAVNLATAFEKSTILLFSHTFDH